MILLHITQNLRENNFVDSTSAKSIISTLLEALNCDFYHFLNFLETEITKKSKLLSKIEKKKWYF